MVRFTDPKHVPKEIRDQFQKKVEFCSLPLDFNDDSKQVKEKQERLQYLQELFELLKEPNFVINLVVPHLDYIIKMIEKNIFRPLPILKKQATNVEIGMDDDDVLFSFTLAPRPSLDPSSACLRIFPPVDRQRTTRC